MLYIARINKHMASHTVIDNFLDKQQFDSVVKNYYGTRLPLVFSS